VTLGGLITLTDGDADPSPGAAQTAIYTKAGVPFARFEGDPPVALVGSGDVVGPAGATDNAVARYDTTTGKLLQDSLVTIGDTGNVGLPALATVDGRDVSADGTKLDTIATGAEVNPAAATQAEAEAGTEVALRTFSPLRVAQAIAALSGGGSTPLLEEQFCTSNVVDNTIGALGWRSLGNGTANTIAVLAVAKHPGVVRLNPGTAALGRRSLHLGQTGVDLFILTTTGPAGNTIRVEWLVRLDAVIAATVELVQLGLIAAADFGIAGAVQNGIFVQFSPTASALWRVAAANGGTTSVQAGTTAVAAATWYRVGFVYTDTGSGGSLQLQVNGVNEGSPVTTNIPTAALIPGMKADGLGVAYNVDIDRFRLYHAQNEGGP
jgi:hypothetical protein